MTRDHDCGVEVGIGAECVPNLDHLRDQIAAVRQATAAAIENRHQDLVAAHNQYAVFTTLLALYTTGHRFCRDPFSDLAAISWLGKFCTVSDKVITPRHANRLLFMPDICLDQLRLYISHLDGLARRLVTLSGRAAEIGIAIIEMLQGRIDPDRPTVPRLPFLFLLSEDLQWTRSISLETLGAAYPGWAMPDRGHRYLVESDLHEFGVPQPLIDLQLGHLPTLTHPMGATGALAVCEAGAVLLPALESNARRHGWTVLPGLPTQRLGPVQPHRSRGESQPARIHEQPLWGAARRTELRTAAAEDDHEVVSSVVAAHYPHGIPQFLSKEQTRALRAAVIAACSDAPDRISKRCLILIARLKMERRLGKAIHIPGSAAALFGEDSPFSPQLPLEFDRAVGYRDAFFRWLNQRQNDDTKPGPARKRAEIAVAAALYGALIEPELLSGLACSVPLSLDEYAGTIFVPITHARHHYTRHWQPDQLSARLILGLAKNPAMLAGPVSASEVEGEIVAICTAIGARPKKRTRVWDHLAAIASPFWRVTLPPHLFGIASGAVPTTSLPASALARLATDKAIEAVPDVPEQDLSAQETWSPRHEQGDRPNGSYALFASLIRTFDQEIADDENVGTRKRNRHLKARLVEYVRKLVDHQYSFPPSVRVLAGWLMYLCEHGTLQKRDLSLKNTIRPYFSLVAGNVIARLGERSLLDLDELALTQLYGEILAGSDGAARDHLRGRIKEFHHYLLYEWAVPAVDFVELGDIPDASAGPLQANANIVAQREYFATLQLLSDRTNDSGRYADQLRGLLILGYRFGVRFGEAIRTCVRDLHIDSESGALFLDIKPGVHGDLKSEAGRRLVPALGKLDEKETVTLLRLIQQAKTESPFDPLAGLFSVDGAARRPIDHGDAVWIIHTALRRVTGDRTLRFHHLRHTYANRLYATLMAEPASFRSPLTDLLVERSEAPGGISWREYLTGRKSRDINLLRVIESFLGHVTSVTTAASYLHCMHYVLAEFLPQPESMSRLDAVTAYALGAHRNTVTKTRARKGNDFERSILEPLRRDGAFRLNFGCSLGIVVDPPRDPPAHVEASLQTIDAVLRLYARSDQRLDQIALRMGMPTSAVKALTETAEHLEDQSGFQSYHLVHDSWQSANLDTDSDYPPMPVQVRRELARINEFIRQIPDQTLMRCVDAWATGVHPQRDRHRWVFTSRSAVFDFLDGLAALGFPPRGLGLVIRSGSAAMPDSLIRTIAADIKVHGVERIFHDDQLPHAGRRLGRHTAFALVPLDEPGVTRIYPRWIDHIIFLVGVLTRMRAASTK